MVSNVIYEDGSSLSSQRQSQLNTDSVLTSERESKVEPSENNALVVEPSEKPVERNNSSHLSNESNEDNDEMDEEDKESDSQNLKKKLQKKRNLAKQ